MIVLVCGSRDWTDIKAVQSLLEDLRSLHRDLTVIEGGARGADRFAQKWAIDKNVPWVSVKAEWEKYGRYRAGGIRNQQMIDMQPDAVYAFKDGFDQDLRRGGTEDCVRRARAARIPVYIISHENGLTRSTSGSTLAL